MSWIQKLLPPKIQQSRPSERRYRVEATMAAAAAVASELLEQP